MRTLFISRHAEAEANCSQDLQRCLTSKGEKQACWLANYFLNQDIDIDVIITSTAKRAFLTSQTLMEKLHIPKANLLVYAELYNAELSMLLKTIRAFDKAYRHPLIIGHNPGLSELIHYLSDTDIGYLPTCGTCGLTFDINSWEELFQGTGTLQIVTYPELKGA